MMGRSRVRAVVLAAMGLGVVGIGVAGSRYLGRRPEAKRAEAPTPADSNSTLPELSRAIARGDGMALAVLKARLEAKGVGEAPEAPAPAMSEAEAAGWIDAVAGLRAGFSRFSSYGRASAVVATSEILGKFAEGTAPANWLGVLPPAADVLCTALADRAWEVRVAALSEVKSLWKWTARRDLLPVESKELAAWKSALHGPVVARLKDAEAGARTAAVACLGLRSNEEAEPALRHLDDPDPGVRLQVLISFADRPKVLPEETILPLLYDPSEFVPPMAERILKARGLSAELLGLGKLVVHPRADMRVTAIPFLKGRGDIDPVVWLLYLSRDREESVRMKALEALAVQDAPEARQRVSEMAAGDASPKVRERAEELRPGGDATAAALPPLPGASAGSLKLKAN